MSTEAVTTPNIKEKSEKKASSSQRTDKIGTFQIYIYIFIFFRKTAHFVRQK